MKVIAHNIQWNIDIDDAYERLDEMTAEKAAEELEIPVDKYANMTTEERHDFAYDLWHHSPATLNEFMGLPDEVEIPEEIHGSGEYLGEDIADWLSDTFGFCHKSFDIKHKSKETKKEKTDQQGNWLNDETYRKTQEELESWPEWKHEAYKKFWAMPDHEDISKTNSEL